MREYLVFDTNILISGYLWSGKPRQAIQLVKQGRFGLLYCQESIDELVSIRAWGRGLKCKFLKEAERRAYTEDSKGVKLCV